MKHSGLLLTTLFALAIIGCAGGSAEPKAPKPQPVPPPFLNRVWQVVEAADIPAGTYYAFLSDNSLLVTAPGASAPKLGRWHFAGGGLVLIEDGYRYPADILEVGPERFSLRLHRPGGAVDVRMAARGGN